MIDLLKKDIGLAVKYCFIMTLRLMCQIFYIFPIKKNKVTFISFGGTQCSCNPLYICRKIEEKYPGRFVIFWRYKSQSCQNVGVKCNYLPLSGLKYTYHILTSACIVTNDSFQSFLPFRRKQLVINTWHGGGLFKKTYGNSSDGEYLYEKKMGELHNSVTKLFTSSSKAWSDVVVRGTFSYKGDILDSGMARNDIFFYETTEIRNKVKKIFNIPKDEKIVLYAPTYRGSHISGAKNTSIELDIHNVVLTLEHKFNSKFHFIFRGHHLMNNHQNISGIIDATSYPDMQELLVTADVFISDYSSCLWDYSLSYNPCFIFAPDFDEYAQKPGFESDYRQWPFPIAYDNTQLCQYITDFDLTRYKEKALAYQNKYGSYETGHASERIADYIADYII